MMRLLKDFSRRLFFWSPRQSWSSRYFSASGLPFHSNLPLSLSAFFPSTCPCKAAIGSLSPSMRSTCTNQRSLLFLIFSTTVSRAQAVPLFFSFLTFSSLYTPAYDSPQSAHLRHQQA